MATGSVGPMMREEGARVVKRSLVVAAEGVRAPGPRAAVRERLVWTRRSVEAAGGRFGGRRRDGPRFPPRGRQRNDRGRRGGIDAELGGRRLRRWRRPD